MRPSIKTFLIALMLGFLPTLTLAAASETPALTEAQKAAVESVIHDYLTKKNPEIIIEAAKQAQMRMEKESSERDAEAIGKNQDKLLNDPNSPVGGNPKGDVSVVEFFDYQCGYCKLAQPFVARLVNEDKNVRVIYKEFGILGPVSIEASKAALASVAQGKYLKFHEALMTTQDHLSSDSIYQIAKSVGLDVERLKKDMASDKVKKLFDDNQELAREIGARGTPTFVIDSKLYPGAVPYEQLKKLVADARANKKK